MFFFLLSRCLSEEENYAPRELTDRNFDEVMKDIPIAFVMANKEGISFCTDVIPVFNDSAYELKGKVQFIIIESSKTEKIRAKYGIYAYPSFFVFRYGKVSTEYRGQRVTRDIVNYLTRISGPNYVKLDDGRSVRDFLDSEITSVVLAAEDADPELLSTFNEVAKELKDHLAFAAVVDPDAIDLLNIDETPALQLTRLQDRVTLNFPLTNAFTENTMKEWIIKNIVPRYYMRDSVILRDLGQDSRYTIMAFVDSTRKKNLDIMHNIMNDVVNEFKENFTYVYCDIFDMGNIVLSLGFQGTHDPCFAILKLTNGDVKEKHILPDKYDATPRRVLSFVRKFYNQTVNRKLVSEPEPTVNNGPLKKLVGKTFLNVTLNPKMDIVLLCNRKDDEMKDKAMLVMKQVAAEFEKQRVKTVEFYYINLTANDTPGVKIPDSEESSDIIIWPAEEQKHPVLLRSKMDARTLSTYIINNGKSKFRFRMPRKFNVVTPDQEL